MPGMIATARAKKRITPKIPAPVRGKTVHTLAPWSCDHFGDRSEIRAYVMAAGNFEIIARIDQTKSIDAGTTANFIIRAVNDYEKMQNFIGELVGMIDLCIASGNLDRKIEREAELTIAYARQDGLLP